MRGAPIQLIARKMGTYQVPKSIASFAHGQTEGS